MLLDRTHCGLAGSEKWASTSPYWITSSGLASGVSREELPFEPNYKCRNKKQIKGILKVSYRFITSWQLHSNDFRLQSVVDLRCHEYDFCLFDTQTHVVFLLFLCRYFVHGIRPSKLCCLRVS